MVKISKSIEGGQRKGEMDWGHSHSQRGGHGEAKVLDILLSESSRYFTPFTLSFPSHETKIDTHGGERTQQEKANTEPSTVLGDTQ